MKKVSCYSEAVGLVLQLALDRPAPGVQVRDVPSGSEEFSLREYRPRWRPKKPRGDFIIFHGLHRLGNRDPRIENLARSVSSLGFRALTPNHPEVVDHRLEADAVASFRRHLDHQVRFLEETGGGFPVIMGPSYLGSICLDAVAGSPSLQSRVAAMCAIGSFARMEDFQNFALTDPRSQPYGRIVLSKNLFLRAGTMTTNLRKGFEWLFDNSLDLDERGLDGLDQTCFSKEELKILSDSYKHDTVRAWLEKEPLELPVLTLPESLRELRVPLFLLHGLNDSLIPSEHSRELFSNAPSGYAHLCITTFLDHGDIDLTPAGLRTLGGIVEGMALLFRNAVQR